MKNILDISLPVQYLKHVGPKRAESFNKAGIFTVRDLLYYFPFRHLDRSNILTIGVAAELINSGFDGEITVMGEVVSTETVNARNKKFLKVIFKDKKGYFEGIWFNGIKYFTSFFEPGKTFIISAKPNFTRYGNIQFSHPDYDSLSSDESQDFFNTGKIIPVYSITKELRTSNLGEFSLRKILSYAVETFQDYIPETLPENIVKRFDLLSCKNAVSSMHFPDSAATLEKAKQRFKYEEFFYFEILVALRKFSVKNIKPGIAFTIKTGLIKSFLSSLPFELTQAQLRVLHEIRLDMEKPIPMNRLIQGDVGSGKTIVALIAMLIAVDNGKKAALMVPTEILADQHYKKISLMLAGFNIRCALILGGLNKNTKNESLREADIIIGTHALIQSDVTFEDLGLAVIDEQHRFGVDQRMALIGKGNAPDVLVMTATPIPRTLTMTLYGDLDISVIDEMPKNRKEIRTVVRSDNSLPEIYSFIKDKIAEGYQAYIVYPLVDESEKLELKAAETHYVELSEGVFADYTVGLLHGKMNWKDKEKVMLDFAAKKYDILISTTVIEVGIDIPDANIIVINDSFRFGLSQLHQLRGRVGRSSKQAYCILIADYKYYNRHNNRPDIKYMSSSEIERNKAAIRLASMVKFPGGFDLSEIDMKLRGPGNIFGTEQSGYPALKYGDITEDSDILVLAKNAAFEVIESDPELKSPSNLLIKQRLLSDYSGSLKYSGIA